MIHAIEQEWQTAQSTHPHPALERAGNNFSHWLFCRFRDNLVVLGDNTYA
jgi:hypothetical protein